MQREFPGDIPVNVYEVESILLRAHNVVFPNLVVEGLRRMGHGGRGQVTRELSLATSLGGVEGSQAQNRKIGHDGSEKAADEIPLRRLLPTGSS